MLDQYWAHIGLHWTNIVPIFSQYATNITCHIRASVGPPSRHWLPFIYYLMRCRSTATHALTHLYALGAPPRTWKITERSAIDRVRTTTIGQWSLHDRVVNVQMATEKDRARSIAEHSERMFVSKRSFVERHLHVACLAIKKCSVRTSSNSTLLLQIISAENSWQIQVMTSVTREQFSVPHEHKIITQFINKIIKCKCRKNTKTIIPAEQESQTSQSFAKQH